MWTLTCTGMPLFLLLPVCGFSWCSFITPSILCLRADKV